MGLTSTVEKLDKYFRRLDEGKAQKIKPSHLDKVMAKLDAKEASLRAELAETRKPSRRERLEDKLALVGEQRQRAVWLRQRLDGMSEGARPGADRDGSSGDG